MKRLTATLALLLIVSAPALGQWTYGPSLNSARHFYGVVEHDGDIYVAGGFSAGTSLEVLYSGGTSWTTLASLPVSQQGCTAALVGDRIYVLGGYGPIDTCQIYDIPSNTWSAGPTLPEPLYWSTAEAIRDKIYLLGGYHPGGSGALDTVYILDTVSNTWSNGSPLPSAIQISTSTVFGNHIYVFGGVGSMFKYDVVMDSWSTIANPPSGHGRAGAVVTVEDGIYLIGGNFGYIYEAFKNVEIYDPFTDSWSTGPDLNIGRYQFDAIYLPSEKRVYAIGGRDENATSLSSVEVLDITAATNPIPDIMANGSDGPVTINFGESIKIYLSLIGGNELGSNADWWVLADTPFSWYFYSLPFFSFKPGLNVTFKGPVFDLVPFEVLDTSTLPAGNYNFYFGVDMIMNGSLDLGSMYYDSINVTVL